MAARPVAADAVVAVVVRRMPCGPAVEPFGPDGSGCVGICWGGTTVEALSWFWAVPAPGTEAITVSTLDSMGVANTAVPPVPALPPPVTGPAFPGPLEPPRPERRRSRLGRLVWSVVLIAVGVLAVVDLAGMDVPASAYLAVPLAVVGAGLVVGGWYGRARSLVVVGAVLSIATALTSAAEHSIGATRATVAWRPTGVEQLDPAYRIGIGNARLDLSGLVFTGRNASVDVSVDVGNLTVLLPRDVDVTVDASVEVGTAQVLGEHWDGIGQARRSVSDNGPDGAGGGQLTLRATVDVGDLEVRR